MTSRQARIGWTGWLAGSRIGDSRFGVRVGRARSSQASIPASEGTGAWEAETLGAGLVGEKLSGLAGSQGRLRRAMRVRVRQAAGLLLGFMGKVREGVLCPGWHPGDRFWNRPTLACWCSCWRWCCVGPEGGGTGMHATRVM